MIILFQVIFLKHLSVVNNLKIGFKYKANHLVNGSEIIKLNIVKPAL